MNDTRRLLFRELCLHKEDESLQWSAGSVEDVEMSAGSAETKFCPKILDLWRH